MKTSLIITVKNDSQSLYTLLESVASQTVLPNEIVVTYIGSIDQTAHKIRKSLPDIIWIALDSDANRSVGRNVAIHHASHKYILISDAGCVLAPDWVEEMMKGFSRSAVVAGYYDGQYENIFEKCQIPYVLVMPDKVDLNTFLPATRSMGIKKSLWKELGGFCTSARYAEDYLFARKIQNSACAIAVQKKAIVYWRPRKTLASFSRMIFEHAYGDAQNGVFRKKVALLFARYCIGFLLFLLYPPILLIIVPYLLYSILKNYRYVRDIRATYYFPLLQVCADISVLRGTVLGLYSKNTLQ